MTDPHQRAEEADRAGPEAQPVDDRSFATFYEAEAASIHRAVRATIDQPAVAREAVDEAMARAYERWSVVGAYEAPAGWVYRTALNWSVSWWRKHRRERAPKDQEDPIAADDVDADGALALAALGRLPLEQRAVVVCRILLELDTRATAEALNIAEGTVKSRLSRGLDALRTTLEVHP